MARIDASRSSVSAAAEEAASPREEAASATSEPTTARSSDVMEGFCSTLGEQDGWLGQVRDLEQGAADLLKKESFLFGGTASETAGAWKTMSREKLEQAFGAMSSQELGWTLSDLGPQDRDAVLRSMVASGYAQLEKGALSSDRGFRVPDLYRVDEKMPPAVRDFLHQQNVEAARKYEGDSAAYVQRMMKDGAPIVRPPDLKEPGTQRPLHDSASLANTRGPGEWLLAKLQEADVAVNPEYQIAMLNDGDKWTAAASLSLRESKSHSVGEDAANVSVQRKGDQYVVSPSFSLDLDLNGRGGGVGEKLSYTYASAREAATAVDQLTHGKPPSVSARTGVEVSIESGLRAEWRSSSVAVAKWSPVSAEAIADAKSETALKFEKRADGWHFCDTVGLGTEAAAKSKLALSTPGFSLGFDKRALDTGEAKVDVTADFKVPPGWTPERAQQDPRGFLESLSAVSPEYHARASVELTHATTLEGGLRNGVELSAECKLSQSEAQKLGELGPAAAFDRLAASAKTEVSRFYVREAGMSVGGGYDTVSAQLGLKGSARHREE